MKVLRHGRKLNKKAKIMNLTPASIFTIGSVGSSGFISLKDDTLFTFISKSMLCCVV
jgi:hypothetical protein